MATKSGLAGLDRALTVAGGPTALTRALGCSKSVVGNWRRGGGIPASKVSAVARATGLSPHELRPDLFDEGAKSTGFAEAQSPYTHEAAALGLDPAAITEAALRKAISDEKARRWNEEHAEAISAYNRYIEEHGLPLAKYRMF